MTSLDTIKDVVATVTDPEIPVLTIEDIGILREIRRDGGIWEIVITPTYSGCPAMNAIEMNLHIALKSQGIEDYRIVSQLSPAWTTEWMTEEGRSKLEEYGIAPPNPSKSERPDHCPQCGSDDVVEVSRFGSTACKALWKCNSCLEPFDYFKCH